LVIATGTKGPLSVPVARTGTKGGAFSPGFIIPVGKPGLKGVSQPGLMLSPALVIYA